MQLLIFRKQGGTDMGFTEWIRVVKNIAKAVVAVIEIFE